MAETDFYVVIPTPVLEMGPYCIAVYAVLRDFADSRSNECWPSHRSIANRSGVGLTRVKQALLELRAAGWVTWEQRANDGGSQTSNRYHVHGSTQVSRGSRHTATASHETATGSHVTPTPLAATRLPGSRHAATELVPNELLPRGTNSSSLADASDGVSDPFDEFWQHYPRKVGKPAARKAFRQALKRATAADITAGAERLRNDPNLPDKSEEQYIPHASTWLNRDGWDDPPLPARQANRPEGRVSAAALALSMIGEGA